MLRFARWDDTGESNMAQLIECFRRPLAAAALALLSAAANAAIVEDIVQLPVSAKDRFGATHQQTITVTVFRDDARARAPFLVFNHGRAGSAEARARSGQAPQFAEHSRWFVERGFAVFVPIRMGYGVSGGPDLEDTGPCANRDFAAGFDAAATQSLAVIAYAQAQPYVVAQRGVLVGQSFGGATTVALAAMNVDGVLGGINFAGGAGGSPDRRPGQPCSEPTLARTFAAYGKTARRPLLWLYSKNDLYWGADYPRSWFEAFRTAGGNAEFVQLPAHGRDGHASFQNNPSAWKPHVERFLGSLGL
jgi:dienelactone hydrolase